MTDEELADLLEENVEIGCDALYEFGRPHTSKYLRLNPKMAETWATMIRRGLMIQTYRVAHSNKERRDQLNELFPLAKAEHNELVKIRRKRERKDYLGEKKRSLGRDSKGSEGNT